MTDPHELEAKLAFDQAFAQLSGQRDTVDHLQSRARDILGLLTLAATFLGAFGRAYSENVLATVKGQAGCIVAMFLFFPAVTVVAALYVMRPRRGWLFDLDADSMRTDMLAREQSQRFSSAEKFYLAYVLKLSEMRQQNECPLRCREWALLAAFATLLITIVWTGFLVWTSSPPDT